MNTREYLPALERIADEIPDKGIVTVARIVVLLMALIVAWAFLGRLDIVVVAEGKLVPETYVKVVQPADSGIVREVLVREGEAVRQGQVLLRLDGSILGTEIAAVAARLERQRLELRRVEAALSRQPLAIRSGDDTTAFRQVLERHRVGQLAHEETMVQAREAARRAETDVLAADQQRSRLEQLLPVHEREMSAYEGLRGKGYVSELEFNAKQKELIDARQALAVHLENLKGLQAAARQAEARVDQLEMDHRTELIRERAALALEVDRLAEDDKGLSFRGGQLELRAPADGVIKDLAVHAAGAVVQPGAVLLTLVPVKERLVAEVYVGNADVGRLVPGTPARIKVQAFRFQRFGMLSGEITMLSADSNAMDRRDANGEPLPYRAIVSVKKSESGRIALDDLAAGMSVTTEFSVGERTPFEYLVDPLRKVAGEAGREGG